VRPRHTDDDRRYADPEPPDPVNHVDPAHPETTTRLAFKVAESGQGEGTVGLVVERHDASALGRIRPDTAHEEHDGAAGNIG